MSSPIVCAKGTFNTNLRATACELATKGHYVAETGRSKEETCADGMYQDNEGASECKQCPAGSICYTVSQKAEPQKCEAGTYSIAGSTVCSNCAAGSYSTKGSSACTNCGAGTIAPADGSSACSACSAGTYSNNRLSCSDCAVGETSNAGASVCSKCTSAPDGGVYTNTNCDWRCDKGRFRKAMECKTCPYGQYRDNVNSDQNSCSQCTYDKISGSYCDVGSYPFLSPIDCSKKECTACTNPRQTNQFYGTSSDQTKYWGTASFMTEGECVIKNCEKCPIGYKRSGCTGTSAGSCAACGTSMASFPTGGYYTSGCAVSQCTLCSQGYYNSKCPDAINTVSTDPGTGYCVSCGTKPENGYYVYIDASIVSSANDCPWSCNTGYRKNGASKTCVACSLTNGHCATVGTYREACNANTGADQACSGTCQPSHSRIPKPDAGSAWTISLSTEWGSAACHWWCVKDYYYKNATQRCEACTSFTVATCSAGYEAVYPCKTDTGLNTAPKCQPCAEVSQRLRWLDSGVANNCQWECNTGYWSSTPTTACQAWSTNVPCAIAEGKYVKSGTSTSDAACVTCPAGTGENRDYTSACTWSCKAGATLINAASCVPCFGGQYKAASGNGSCTACNAGYYQPNRASLSISCVKAPDDSTVNENKTSFSCKQGYRLEIGESKCISCGHSAVNRATVAYTVDTCTLTSLTCNAGYYRTSTACAACAPVTNAATVTDATPTGSVTVCGAAPGSCTTEDEMNAACAKPSACNVGYYMLEVAQSKTKTITCAQCTQITCSAGQQVQYCTGNSQQNTCIACATANLKVGYALEVGCKEVCAKGYNGGYLCIPTCKQWPCAACGRGLYKNSIGDAAACSQCPVGTYTNTYGNWQCTPCDVGTYTTQKETIQCTTCAAGLNGPAGAINVCKTSYDLFTEVSTSNGKARHIVNTDTVPVSTLQAKAHTSSISPTGGFVLCYAWTESTIYKYTYAMGMTVSVAGVVNTEGFADGFPGVSMLRGQAGGLAVAADGSYALITDRGNHRIRKLDLNTNYLSTVAGSGVVGAADGVGTNAKLNGPMGISLAWDNSFAVITEYNGRRIRKFHVATQTTSLLAGDNSMDTGATGTTDGVGNNARFQSPMSIAISSDAQKAYIGEMFAMSVRCIDITSRQTYTLTSNVGGSSSGISISPFGNYLLVASMSVHKIYKIPLTTPTTAGTITVYAGSGSNSDTDGTGTSASMSMPQSVDIWRCGMKGYGAVSASDQCAQCRPGTYSLGYGICTLCPVGYATGVYGATACQRCEPNTISVNTGASACAPCPTGGQDDGTLPRVRCVAGPGYYMKDGTTITACPAGKYNTLRGANNVISCSTCAQGTYAYPAGQTTCTACPVDSYCVSADAVPTPCPVATPYTTTTGSTSLTQCKATLYSPCRAGFFVFSANNPTKACTQCKGATYCANDIITACSPYSNTMWHAPVGASNVAQCEFKSIAGTVSCPAGTMATPNVAMTHIWQCRASAGYYYIPGLHSVGQSCPVGYYCPQGTLQPLPCTPNTCTTLGAQTLAEQCPTGVSAQLPACQTCSSALAANAVYKQTGSCDVCCNAGYYLSAANTCTAVPDSSTCATSSMYRPDPPSTRCSMVSMPACVTCPALGAGVILTSSQVYRTQNAVRMWGTDACVYVCAAQGFVLTGGKCIACAAGTYQAQLYDKTCTSCPYGTFMPFTNASVCWSCGPYGFPNTQKTQCVCVGGAQVGSNYRCEACPYGSITNAGTCQQCPSGRVCAPNYNTSITDCSTVGGSAMVQRYYKADTKSTCKACADGFVRQQISATTQECRRCFAGTYHITGQSSCTPCPINTYTTATGSTVCQACASPFVAPVGSTACVCAAGYYKSSASTCTQCQRNCMTDASLVQTCPMGSTSDVSLCACDGDNSMGDGMNTACANTCPIAHACYCARDFYYNNITKSCTPCRRACPAPATLQGVCEKGTVLHDTVKCVCPMHMYWMGSSCTPCKRCHARATLVSACVAGSTSDTAKCVCNGGYRGNGITACV